MIGHGIAGETWYPQKVAEHETASQVLAAARTAVLERLARLELELSGIIESGSAGGEMSTIPRVPRSRSSASTLPPCSARPVST